MGEAAIEVAVGCNHKPARKISPNSSRTFRFLWIFLILAIMIPDRVGGNSAANVADVRQMLALVLEHIYLLIFPTLQVMARCSR